MHELSIVYSVVEGVCEWLKPQSAKRITRVTLRIGALSGLIADSLQFCYEIASADTPLAGSILEVHMVPTAVFCHQCQELVEIADEQFFQCSRCGAPAGDVRNGREIEIESVEIEDVD